MSAESGIGYDLPVLEAALGDACRHFFELPSTSDKALQLVREGRRGEFVVVADQQTAGRGRRGTAWLSDRDGGLAFSLVVEPTLPRVLWPRLALVAGVAVVRVLERRRFDCEIKWPNDVLIRDCKVCGILCESEGPQVVFGIGANVALRKLPGELVAIATSLALESGNVPTREELLLEIRAELLDLVQLTESSFPDVIAMARERCALSGKTITYLEGGQQQRDHCEGIGDGGELLVRREGQVRRVLSAEEIRIAE